MVYILFAIPSSCGNSNSGHNFVNMIEIMTLSVCLSVCLSVTNFDLNYMEKNYVGEMMFLYECSFPNYIYRLS